MTLSRIDLESFDDGNAAEPRPSAEYTRGFSDGEKFAQSSQRAETKRAIQQISSALSDMTFGYTEARLLLLDRIRPLLAQVAEAVLPQIARESFATHLLDILSSDFGTITGDPIEIAVHPDTVDQLSSALVDHSANFVFVPDETLTDGQARMKNGDRHIMVDLPALTLALQTALNGLEPLERIQSNG